MAGTLRGKIDCRTTVTNADQAANEIGKAFWEFAEAHPGMTRVAYNFGDDTGAFGANEATGTDYWDGANPWGGNHAWVLYRMPANGNRPNDIYIRATWGDSVGSGTAADPLLVGGSTSGGRFFCIAAASALESDGTTNASPWLGTTNNNGSDTVGDVAGVGPVWGAPAGGTLWVFPVANSASGDDSTNKQNTYDVGEILAGSQPAVRYGFVADDDNILFYFDDGDNFTTRWLWVGPFTWRSGISNNLYSIAALTSEGGVGFGTQMGSNSGTDDQEGACWLPNTGEARPIHVTSLSMVLNSTVQPSEISGAGQYEEYPVYLFSEKLTDKGLVGVCDPFIKFTYGITDQDSKTDLSRIVLGGVTTSFTNLSFPWDGSTTPRANTTREGISFP